MGAAYLDSSVLVAIAFAEPAGLAAARVVRRQGALFSSTLLEAEFLAAAEREGLRQEAAPLLRTIAWVHPPRRLSAELERALEHGLLRGADLHHLATALFLAPDPKQLAFLTLAQRQRSVAVALGFRQPLP